MTKREFDTETTGLALPTVGRLARLIGRALVLHCPNCGKGPVLQHWLKMRVRCGSCGIRIERGESDYFMGSLLLNYSLTGVLLLAGVAAVVLATKPNINWDILEWGAPIATVLLPVLLFPFTKLLWLVADIALRPVTPEELEWHRASTSTYAADRDGTP